MNVKVSLTKEFEIQINGGITINVDVNVKNIKYVTKIIFGFLLHVVVKMLNRLREKSYFPRLGISWKAQKDLVKYHLSISFFAQKRPYFPSLKSSKQELFSDQ